MRITVSFRSLTEAESRDPSDAFWLVETPENRLIAERIWASGVTDPGSALFRARSGASAADEMLRILANIEDHHPGWDEIWVPGGQLARECRTSLRSLGLSISDKEQGTLVRRR
jgi:hypothetical protein